MTTGYCTTIVYPPTQGGYAQQLLACESDSSATLNVGLVDCLSSAQVDTGTDPRSSSPLIVLYYPLDLYKVN